MSKTELQQRAHDAAIDHGMWLAPDDDETNYEAFVAGYLRGYSDRGVEATNARDEYRAAAELRDKEIEALRKDLAAEVVITRALRARVAELEGLVPRECPECSGSGSIESTGSEHSSDCDGSCRNCPVPVQVIEPCAMCGSRGIVMVPPIPLPEDPA